LPETEPVNHLATTNDPDFVLRLIFQSGRQGSVRDYTDGHGALQSDIEHPDPRHLNISRTELCSLQTALGPASSIERLPYAPAAQTRAWGLMSNSDSPRQRNCAFDRGA